MICYHCEEPILPEEEPRAFPVDKKKVHEECFVRMVTGSAAHLLRMCPCYGGKAMEDKTKTKRQLAQHAFATLLFLKRNPDVAPRKTETIQ